jgi:hypothetical protein
MPSTPGSFAAWDQSPIARVLSGNHLPASPNEAKKGKAMKLSSKHYEFVADSPKPGTGGKSVLYVDGQQWQKGTF